MWCHGILCLTGLSWRQQIVFSSLFPWRMLYVFPPRGKQIKEEWRQEWLKLCSHCRAGQWKTEYNVSDRYCYRFFPEARICLAQKEKLVVFDRDSHRPWFMRGRSSKLDMWHVSHWCYSDKQGTLPTLVSGKIPMWVLGNKPVQVFGNIQVWVSGTMTVWV